MWPLAAVLGLVVVIAVLVADPSSPGVPAGMAPQLWSSAPVQSELAAKATEILARGRAEDAVALLESSETLDDDAAAQLVLGHAHVARKDARSALEAYARAVALTTAAGRDPGLLANTAGYLASKSARTATSSLDVLIAAAEPTENSEARRAVVEAATHSRRQVRESAQAAAERLGLEGLDWVSINILELHQGRRCKDRLAAVIRLRELGDRAAVEALRRAERRMSGGLLGLGSKNVNQCLSKQARDAADYLESL